jgi:hypothetical protein
MREFHQLVVELWRIEQEAAKSIKFSDYSSKRDYQTSLQAEASKISGYQEVRRQVAKGVLRAERIASHFGVPINFISYPAPAVGGPIIEQKVFSAILKDISHGGLLNNQAIYDAINQTIGECEARLSIEKKRLINPFYWIKELIVAIIRIPFMLFEASGFDVSKIEDHFIGRFFKLLEIGIVIYILLRLGIEKESIQQILIKLF